MKKQYLVSMLALCAFIMVSITIPAQMPLPCVEYTNDNVTTLYGFHGSKSVGCMEINMEETPIHMNDDDVRDYHVQDASIKTGYSYVPSGDNGRFSITLGEREEMEGAWFEPINYFPQLYEKIEWGLKLPAEVEQAIDNWINNDQYGTEHYPALNPFDPDQIDVKAIVDYTDESGNYHSQPVFGFFYRDYQRITVYNNPYGEDMGDPDNWRWDEIPTEFRFRFRWASDVISHHSVRLTVNVPSMGYWELAPFEFDSYWGDPRQSFVSVTDNGHYFKTADNHVFFPVGLNINEGTFGCNCMEGVADTWEEMSPEDCEECYGEYNPVFNSTNSFDPCCGIRKNKRKRGHDISPEQFFDENGVQIFDSGLMVQGYTLAPAAYLKLEQVLKTLQEKGGNSFRTIIDPTTFEVEFEKLNNYFDRQYQAWEFDQMLDRCRELDLRVELNMLMHYSFMHHAFGNDKFDWDNTFNSGGIDPGNSGTHGYCYWRELGLDTPLDFLTNPAAINYYKKKIRYMIARWGYSKNIFLLELASEINNIGKNDAATGEDAKSLYDKDLIEITVRPAVANWHNEIARYIKMDLQHFRHLIAVDYTGKATMSGYNDANNDHPCASEYLDFSYNSEYVDVLGYNNYGANINKFEGNTNSYGWIEEDFGQGTSIHPGFLCNLDMSTEILGFQHTQKPVINPETGFGPMGCDASGFVRELVTIPFSGHASSGMSWDEWSSSENWNWMGHVSNFLETELLDAIDLNTQTWIPGYAHSDGSELTEAIYLRDPDEDHSKLIGVILNRTWNWFTASEGGECDQLPIVLDGSQDTVYSNDGFPLFNLEELPVSHMNPINIGAGEQSIDVDGIGSNRYRLKYYDPITLYTINEETRTVIEPDEKLRLEGYPLLTQERPFVFFKVWRDPLGDNTEEFSPTIDSEIITDSKGDSQTNNIKMQNALVTSYLSHTGVEFVLGPCPASKYFLIQSTALYGMNLRVVDMSGRTVIEIPDYICGSLVDTSMIKSGVYLVTLNNSTVLKLIIQ